MNFVTTPTSTEIKFNCPGCGQHILASAEWSGLGISCPSCNSRISIPSPSNGESNTQPPTAPRPTPVARASEQTIRIQLPRPQATREAKPSTPAPLSATGAGQDTASETRLAAAAKLASAVTPSSPESEIVRSKFRRGSFPDFVRELESGAMITSEELTTALFHELMAVRQRLEELETRVAQNERGQHEENGESRKALMLDGQDGKAVRSPLHGPK